MQPRTVLNLDSFTPGSASLHPGLLIYHPFRVGFDKSTILWLYLHILLALSPNLPFFPVLRAPIAGFRSLSSASYSLSVRHIILCFHLSEFVHSVRSDQISFFDMQPRTVLNLDSFTPGSASLHPGLLIYHPFRVGFQLKAQRNQNFTSSHFASRSSILIFNRSSRLISNFPIHKPHGTRFL